MKQDAHDLNEIFSQKSDSVSHLPMFSLALYELEKILKDVGKIGVIVLDLYPFFCEEELHGWEILDHLVSQCAVALKNLRDSSNQLILMPVLKTPGDDFIVFYFPEKATDDISQEIKKTAEMIVKTLQTSIKQTFSKKYFAEVSFLTGTTVISFDPRKRIERLLNAGIKKAYLDLYNVKDYEKKITVAQLKKMIHEKKLINYFQPIVDLKTFEIYGYEALLRFSDDNLCHYPKQLVDHSIDQGIVYQLERMIKTSAVEIMKSITGNQLLFLNFESVVLEEFHKMLTIFNKLEFSYDRIVFELTERTAVTNFEKLKKSITSLRKKGFKFAIDDAGSGYASMESIVYLEPEYLKIDMSIVRDIHRNYIKQDIVQTLIALSQRTGARLIAEGIENSDEAACITSMGITFGQGFFFSRPSSKPIKRIQLNNLC